ncbi:MAG: YezD family protein [Thermaerobacter sp.]|jgi:hypothetical protein|nr:YezD family protein [Thermaerobacter sp.]MDA8146385.1 YezD family protein [Thermaerobacter sp.]
MRGWTPAERALMERIAAVLRGVRYGQVNIVIQDSRVVQIEVLEKTRLVECYPLEHRPKG